MKKRVGAKLKVKDGRIELEPFGITAGMDRARPVMLFREKNGEAVLPVWLSPLDAGIALSQHNTQIFPDSPHDVPLQALTLLGVKPEECLFNEVRGLHQYVELKFSGSKKLKTMKARADHAVSFCLQAKVRFFCTREHLERSRNVQAQIGEAQLQSVANAQTKRSGPTYLN